MANRAFVIRARRPWRAFVLGSVALCLILAGLYWTYQQGHVAGVATQDDLRRAHAELVDAHRAQSQKLADVEIALTAAGRDRLVERTSVARLKGELRDVQRANLDLREEIELYRGILEPKKADSPQIVSFRLLDDAPAREADGVVHRFRVVLTSAAQAQALVAGSIGLSVTGKFRGELRSYDFSELSGTNSSELRFRFKQYQRVEGRVKLPPGLVPQRVTVRAITDTERRIERAFDWPRPLG
ncbi:MAG: DUF6776 family protein [Pseudomonadota bacterium]